MVDAPAAIAGTQSIAKGLALLQLFSTQTTHLTVTQAAVALGIPRPSAHRLLAVLHQHGFLRQDRPGGAYALGGRIVALADAYRASQPLAEFARPHMQALCTELDQTTNLYVRVNAARVVIERFESSHPVQLIRQHDPQPIGIGTGAAGRLLAMSADAARRAGVVVTRGERVAGACGIAAAIFDERGAVVAALDVSGPIDRFPAAVIERSSRAVLRAAEQISADVGGAVR
jgi:DNA-binding IclR family transcriptional regulator